MDPVTLCMITVFVTTVVVHNYSTYYGEKAVVARINKDEAIYRAEFAKIELERERQEQQYNLDMADKQREELQIREEEERKNFQLHSQQEREMKLIGELSEKISTQMVLHTGSHVSVLEEQSKAFGQALMSLGKQFEQSNLIQLEILKRLERLEGVSSPNSCDVDSINVESDNHENDDSDIE